MPDPLARAAVKPVHWFSRLWWRLGSKVRPIRSDANEMVRLALLIRGFEARMIAELRGRGRDYRRGWWAEITAVAGRRSALFWAGWDRHERDFQSLNLGQLVTISTGIPIRKSLETNSTRFNGPVLDRPIELSQHTSAASTERLIDEGVDALRQLRR